MTRENQSIVTFDISEKQNYRDHRSIKDGRGFREWKVERTFSQYVANMWFLFCWRPSASKTHDLS